MRRRALLAALSTAALAGCTAIPGGDSDDGSTPPGRTPTAPPTPVPFPDRPDDLAHGAVAAYVREHEHATVHDGAVEGDVTSVGVSCRSATSDRTDGGVVAFAVCTGGISYADGTHGDLGTVPAAYYVTPDRTVRLDGYAADRRCRPPEAVFAAESPAENVGDPDFAARGLRLCNFDDAERRVAVSVRYLGDESSTGTAGTDAATSTPAYDATYRLDPRSIVVAEDVAVREGEYRVEARLAAGPTATHLWRLAEHSGGFGPAVAATPEPDVVVGPVGV